MGQTASRTKYSIHNTLWGAIFFVLKMLLQFVVRALFIRFFGKELLGLNGVFTNVLTMLSLAELGIGNAIVYSMYEPIAKGDTEKTKALLRVYRNVYIAIGTIVTVVGLALIPALPYLIKDVPNVQFNITVLYIIYLAHTVFGYFFAYRRSLVFASQRNDIENKVGIISQLVTAVIQIIVMVTSKNYYYYALALLIGSVVDSVTIFAISYKLFPELRGKAHKLAREDGKTIVKNSAAKFVQSIGWHAVFSTDSLIISGFLGLGLLGIYSNYTMVMTSLISVVNIFCSAVKSSVGNMMAVADKERVYFVFRALMLALFWLIGFIFTGMVCCYQDFMLLFTGSDEYLLPLISMLLISLQFYFRVSRYMVETFKDCAGLFWNDWFRPLLEAGLNIGLDFLLLHFIGLNGVVLATITTTICVSLWIEAFVLFKNYFHRSLALYFVRYVVYTFLIFIVSAATFLVCYFVPTGGIWWFLLKLCICLIMPNILFLLLTFKTPEFKYLSGVLKNILFRKKKTEEHEEDNGKESMYGNDLKKLQQTETEILSVIDAFCRERGIVYSLYAGTALGAVRHGGFIPWDDDMDICMERNEYDRFLSEWRANPVRDYKLEGDDEPGCRINHSKILKSEEDIEDGLEHTVWVDVFAMDKVPVDKKKRKKLLKCAKLRLVYTRDYAYTRGGVLLNIASHILLAKSKKYKEKLKNKYSEYVKQYCDLQSDFEYASLACPEELSYFHPSDLFEVIETDFEGRKFFITRKSDEMLTIMYGDYMQLPPEKDRVCKHSSGTVLSSEGSEE